MAKEERVTAPDNRRKYIVEMEWRAGDKQYEPDELLELLRESIGMDGYDIKWYSCVAAPEPASPEADSLELCRFCGKPMTDQGKGVSTCDNPECKAPHYTVDSRSVPRDIVSEILAHIESRKQMVPGHKVLMAELTTLAAEIEFIRDSRSVPPTSQHGPLAQTVERPLHRPDPKHISVDASGRSENRPLQGPPNSGSVGATQDAPRAIFVREGKMPTFRKKVTIEAVQWFKLGDHPKVVPVPSNHPSWNCPEQAALCGWLGTLEGGMDGAQFVTPGDWIATGISGENWPIKPDIFAATYELVEASGPTKETR